MLADWRRSLPPPIQPTNKQATLHDKFVMTKTTNRPPTIINVGGSNAHNYYLSKSASFFDPQLPRPGSAFVN